MNRQIVPEIKPISSIRTGFPERDRNIFRLDSEEGVFKLEIVFPGAGYGTIGNKFHGLYATELLLSGTASKSAHRIAEEIDALGGFVFKSCDYYSSSITIFGINENFPKLLHIVKDAVDNCVFSQSELDVYKSRKLSELRINLGKTNYLANRSINCLVMGSSHPYSKYSTEVAINEVDPEVLIAYKQDCLKIPYFIFTGAESTPLAEILINSGFGQVPYNSIEAGDVSIDDAGGEERIVKAGSTQNSIRMGKMLPSRKDNDYFTISLFNLILGGFFGSRLMKNIREEKGLTYGIHSSITPFKDYSLFKISSECNSKLSLQVKEEIINEVTRLQSHLIEKEELTVAKNYLLGALARSFDGAFNISERLKAHLDLHADSDYYSRYFEAINNISPEQLLACANNYFSVSSLKYCVAGEV